jgi:high-affinity iron transporter
MHNRRKKALLSDAADPAISKRKVFWGLVFLGFTSMYREGFEVVLFLQSYRLKLGGTPVLKGVVLGLFLAAIVAVIAFVANHRLPYRKMLVATGVLLGVVLLVMVGEQAQEMQLAGWLSITPIASLSPVIPDWVGLWFAVFPTVETLAAQGIALVLVLGSYALVRLQLRHDQAVAEG